MTLIVEDGTGRTDAESYVSYDEVQQYAMRMNRVWRPDSRDAGEAACRVATAYIDSTYRFMFQGAPTQLNKQALEWPRASVFYSGKTMPSDKLPKLLKDATCEAAIREAAKPGCLLPDVNRGANISSITADSVSISYAGGGLMQGVKVYPQIAMCLSPLFMSNNPLSGSAGRG